jgi:GT2 family glycosyltransferase
MEFLNSCLASIYKQINSIINFEIIVVDNGSEDRTVDMIKKDFPDVLLIENVKNKGVARARNQSIKCSKGRYILLLDSDTEFVEGNFLDIINYLDSSPEIGLLGVKQIAFDNKPYPAARTFPKPKHIILRRLAFLDSVKNSKTMKRHHLLFSDQSKVMEVDYVIGAFQLIRKEVLDSVGLLDEDMFYGFEDADYCARVKKAGYKVVYYPYFMIKHYVQGMTRKNLFSKTAIKLLFSHFKSYLKLYLKHRDLLQKGT